MKTSHKNLIYIFFVLFVSACSSEQKHESTSQRKIYSRSTERAFADIENNDLGNSQRHYLNLNSAPREVELPRQMPKETPKIKPSNPKLSSPKKLSPKNQERMEEINQNLAFFCMKHRKDPAFSNEEKCLAFTKKVLSSCENKHQSINSVMLNCIKNHLKKGR